MRKSYFYQTWSKDRCGCKRSSAWHETKADSKKEVRDRVKRWDNTVTVLSAPQMQALLASAPGTEVFYL